MEMKIVSRAKASARKHGIKLIHGTPNNSDGNCAIESAIFNINDRDCFPESLIFSADYYRRIWMTDMKNRTIHDKTWNIYSAEEWELGWAEMMKSGVYERGLFGDLMLLAIACGIKKYILIFNTSLDAPHDPVFVCDPRKFGVEPDSQIPVVFAYNLVHYESMNTLDKEDDLKTIDLVQRYLTGRYEFGRKDIPHLLKLDEEENNQQIRNESEPIDKNADERSEGSMKFEELLPENLRGKRPRDMSKDEKKVYNNVRARLSRSRKSSEQVELRKSLDREAKTKRKSNEIEIVKEERRQKEAEAQKRKRSNESEADKEERRHTEAEAYKRKRSKESEAEQEERRNKEAKAQNRKRSKESEAEKEERNRTDAQRFAEKIGCETPLESKKRIENVVRNRTCKRAKESEAEKKAREVKEASLKHLRRSQYIPKSQYLARNALKVLSGEQIVPLLNDSENKLGSMDVICEHCHARKWKSETPSLCCNGGKVKLEPFPDPPQLIQDLLTNSTSEANLFKENTRTFNNALALSSVVVKEKRFKNGYSPSVIFEGKVMQMYGPLQTEEGETPRFAQLYVHDPATEQTIRVKNMCLPKHLSKNQINIITNTMGNLQKLLKEVNPFVNDLLHICEIPDSDLQDGKIIISCKKKTDQLVRMKEDTPFSRALMKSVS